MKRELRRDEPTPEDVHQVRLWVQSSRIEPGALLPALAEIAQKVRLPVGVVRSALDQLAGEQLVTLHDGYRHYAAGTITPTERAYRVLRATLHTVYDYGDRFMSPQEAARAAETGVREATAALRRMVEEGLLTPSRYVHPFSPGAQRQRAAQLRERAAQLRREALDLMNAARRIEDGQRNVEPAAPA